MLCISEMTAKGETVKRALSTSGACFGRDALAKFVYSTLFNWIVTQINHVLTSGLKQMDEVDRRYTGILDIYGFETLQVNSFEQLCINYANEKLQQQFNDHVFKLQQEDYAKEGIPWTKIEYNDNQ